MLLSIAGLVWLVFAAVETGGFWRIASAVIFGSSMITLYLASTLFHSFKDERIRKLFQVFDHSAIYLLIAGSYTPFALIALGGDTGWMLFYIIWGLAGSGIFLKLFFTGKFQIVSTILYVAMGWIALFYMDPLFANLPNYGIGWMVAGGVIYTLGVIFYLWEKLPYSHVIWHLFVMGGTASHFIAVLFYVMPMQQVVC